MPMRIRLAVPPGLNKDETAAVLDAALEAVTRASAPLIARGRVPTFVSALKRGGIKWKPEPPGDEHFDLPKTVIGRGWGDCDDLAPWHAASLRASGIDPEARAVVRPSGPNRWHAFVVRGNGKPEDPSKAAGMGVVGGDEYSGPFWPAMFGDRLSLAAYPYGSQWAARVDVPSAAMPMVYSAVTGASSPRRAMVRSLEGAMQVSGDDCDDVDLVRLAGLCDLLRGEDPAVVGEVLDHIGAVGFLPALLPAAASIAAPLASKALSAFGMGPKGAPAPPAAPSGGGGGGGGIPSGATMHCPGGPIIVRF